jgi:hypothetical protein
VELRRATKLTRIEVVAIVGDKNQAAVLYDMATTPFGTLRVAEHLQVSSGRIVGSRLVFDTYPVRATDTNAG